MPGVRMVDAAEGMLGMEWIDGKSVRKLLPGGAEDDEDDFDVEVRGNSDGPLDDEDALSEYGISLGTCLSRFPIYPILIIRCCKIL